MNSVALAPSADPAPSLRDVVEELSALLDRTVVVRDRQHNVTTRSGSPSDVTRHLRVVSPADGVQAEQVDFEAPVTGRAGLLGRSSCSPTGIGRCRGATWTRWMPPSHSCAPFWTIRRCPHCQDGTTCSPTSSQTMRPRAAPRLGSRWSRGGFGAETRHASTRFA